VSKHPASETKRPDPYDLHVGQRLRAARLLAGLSQTKLGDHVGLTFQQIQKYEKGMNRIGASRLQQFSQLLNVPPAYFFEGLEGTPRIPGSSAAGEVAEAGSMVDQRSAVELLRHFGRIKNVAVRQSIATLVKNLAEQNYGGDVSDAA